MGEFPALLASVLYQLGDVVAVLTVHFLLCKGENKILAQDGVSEKRYVELRLLYTQE